MAKSRKPVVEGMTIEQLAQRSGVTTRNIRAYQTKALLPPPKVRKKDRVGLYGSHHLARLRLIARLQDSGYSLAGVAHLLEAWDSGHTLDQVLGIGEVVESARDSDSIPIAHDAIGTTLPTGFGTDDAVAALMAAGILVPVKDGFELRHPLLLEMAREATRGGIPAPLMLEELARIGHAVDEIARRFVSHFHRYVSGPYVTAGMPLDELPELQLRLQRLRTLAQHLLTPLMSDALDRESELLMRKLLPRPVAGPAPVRRSARRPPGRKRGR